MAHSNDVERDDLSRFDVDRGHSILRRVQGRQTTDPGVHIPPEELRKSEGRLEDIVKRFSAYDLTAINADDAMTHSRAF
jgi:hypothetical protein